MFRNSNQNQLQTELHGFKEYARVFPGSKKKKGMSTPELITNSTL